MSRLLFQRFARLATAGGGRNTFQPSWRNAQPATLLARLPAQPAVLPSRPASLQRTLRPLSNTPDHVDERRNEFVRSISYRFSREAKSVREKKKHAEQRHHLGSTTEETRLGATGADDLPETHLTLTDAAAQQILELMELEPGCVGIRVSIKQNSELGELNKFAFSFVYREEEHNVFTANDSVLLVTDNRSQRQGTLLVSEQVREEVSGRRMDYRQSEDPNDWRHTGFRFI